MVLVPTWLLSSPVDAGHRAVIFDRFRGVQDVVVGEGTHFLIPWVQKPIIFDCRSRPRNIPVITGSKGERLLWFGFFLEVEIPNPVGHSQEWFELWF